MDAHVFLSPREVLDLAVLGVVSERARTAAEVISMVKRVGGARFQPTTGVIAGRIAALAEAGLLTSARSGGSSREVVWRPSAAGQVHVERLLLTPSSSPADALAAVCACLKLCFLELLRPTVRDAVIEDLKAAHRRARDEARRSSAGSRRWRAVRGAALAVLMGAKFERDAEKRSSARSRSRERSAGHGHPSGVASRSSRGSSATRQKAPEDLADPVELAVLNRRYVPDPRRRRPRPPAVSPVLAGRCASV